MSDCVHGFGLRNVLWLVRPWRVLGFDQESEAAQHSHAADDGVMGGGAWIG